MRRPPRGWRVAAALTLASLLLVLALSPRLAAEPPAQPEPPAAEGSAESEGDERLFDGRTLDGWQPTRFGGEGEVFVEDGAVHFDFGVTMTGITYQRPLPKTNYEISLEAMRVDGIDFFCGLTFPVDDSHCSLIVGGWAGSVVGLSSIDGQDAARNETTRYLRFEKGRWYAIRLRVTPQRIQAWIDDQPVIDQPIGDRQLSLRNEVLASRPLGIAAWQTRAAVRDIRLKRL